MIQRSHLYNAEQFRCYLAEADLKYLAGLVALFVIGTSDADYRYSLHKIAELEFINHFLLK